MGMRPFVSAKNMLLLLPRLARGGGCLACISWMTHNDAEGGANGPDRDLAAVDVWLQDGIFTLASLLCHRNARCQWWSNRPLRGPV